jgi:poly-gamma-glutamate synthase PgsB/CapB
VSDDFALSQQLAERLRAALHPLDAKLRSEAVLSLCTRLVGLTDGQVDNDLGLVPALIGAAAEAVNRIDDIKLQVRELTERYEEAATPVERAAIVRQHLSAIEVDRARLVGDLAAMRRNLDLDAVLERHAERISVEVDRVHLAYAIAGALLKRGVFSPAQLRALDADGLFETAFGHAFESSYEIVMVKALEFGSALVACYPTVERLSLLGASRFRTTRRFAADDQRGPFAQVAALELSIAADPKRATDLVRERLEDRAGRDGMIVRHEAIRRLSAAAGEPRAKLAVLALAKDDPSEHVRQGLARALAELGSEPALTELARLAQEDSAIPVRGFALRELGRVASRSTDAARTASSVLAATADALTTRTLTRAEWVLVDVLLEQVRALCAVPEPLLDPELFATKLAKLLESESLTLGLAERVGSALLSLEVRRSAKLDEYRRTLADTLDGAREGERRKVDFFPETSLAELEKALAVVAQDGLPVSLAARGHGRFTLTLGERRTLRLWRLLFELRTPAPDKRMGYAHTHARKFEGEIAVAPLRMGEVTPTRVPGERHLIQELGTWGQFLPRVDDLLIAASLRAEPRRVVTSFGTLVIRGPSGLFRRLLARLKLSLAYADYAIQRDVSLSAREPEVRIEYTRRIRALGFSVELENSAGRVGRTEFRRTPGSVERYLGSALAFAPFALPEWLEDLGYTIAAPRSNTAFQLTVVVWLILCGMLLRAALIRRRVERSLSRIPLRIGGWGSRGKSGSERIKAALFHGLRFDVVVKTTGCEAMFIHARRDREARELFLYRPYDKATIWEQEKVVGFGSKLGAQVFLWECMALQPRFVSILMDEWMQDELATLTNAYPDHEDIMGPGGEDVARVIGSFMPKKGTVFTAEEQMLPLLRDAAVGRRTNMVEVGPIDAALLPRDLLQRFPYAEHPSNIAMVLAMAEHLGIDRSYALVKMADFVIADLGVLKTYPTVTFSTRKLTFSNGMSANERAGFLSNWIRLGYDELDSDAKPDVVSVVVVNNRADRVARSHVFAQVVARDAICDHVVLIGTNLIAMRRFIIEQFEGYLETLSLGEISDVQGAIGRAESILKRLRVSKEPATLERRLTLVLAAMGLAEADAAARVREHAAKGSFDQGDAEPQRLAETLLEGVPARPADALPGVHATLDDARAHLSRLVRHYADTRRTLATVKSKVEQGDGEGALVALRAHCRTLWNERVYVVEDSGSTGDQTISRIAAQVPPGHDTWVLGCQNIKGTGLDFAYRWVSIGQVDVELTRLEREPRAREAALRFLRGHGDYGLLDARFALARVKALAESDDPSLAALKSELASLAQHLARVEIARAARIQGAPTKSRLSRVLDAVEPLVDHLDSVRRSKRAKRIMDDLFDRRVSQGQAAVLLRDLVARGKGGWLAKDWIKPKG